MTYLKNRSSEDVYLEYANKWLTIGRMADHYDIDPVELEKIIDKGRIANHLRK